MSLDVCVATFASIQTNFKPDLISFPVHITRGFGVSVRSYFYVKFETCHGIF